MHVKDAALVDVSVFWDDSYLCVLFGYLGLRKQILPMQQDNFISFWTQKCSNREVSIIEKLPLDFDNFSKNWTVSK